MWPPEAQQKYVSQPDVDHPLMHASLEHDFTASRICIPVEPVNMFISKPIINASQ
jgi:hypothetical protein